MRKVKKREEYLDMIDEMVKQYAKQKDIEVQLPRSIHKNSFKGYRIIDP